MLNGVVASLAMSLAIVVGVAGADRDGHRPGLRHARSGEGRQKLLIVASVELVDLTLIAAAFSIVGVGLYGLFVGPAHLPDWLEIATLDDLKGKLINVIVVALGVAFLGQVVSWDETTDLLPLGVGNAPSSCRSPRLASCA